MKIVSLITSKKYDTPTPCCVCGDKAVVHKRRSVGVFRYEEVASLCEKHKGREFEHKGFFPSKSTLHMEANL